MCEKKNDSYLNLFICILLVFYWFSIYFNANL
jgi:hypothetical protein